MDSCTDSASSLRCSRSQESCSCRSFKKGEPRFAIFTGVPSLTKYMINSEREHPVSRYNPRERSLTVLQERDHLDLARRHLAEARVRIGNQVQLIERLRAQGHPTDLAESLLKSLLETQEQMRAHRDYIIAKLAAS